eukprot:TRINITY_DN6823_c0_g1_i7.p1 TRINITY_DN6823_c0_g1~~TRINITY_DN6823_c0_g1_i7.p1  ORF type:complete len:564 (-),score=109.43 TRINITY_DN6823_c0_g1_i7:430-2121(-)
MFVLRMIKKKKWLLPEKEWYKRKLLFWRFFIPMYDASVPLNGAIEQWNVLDPRIRPSKPNSQTRLPPNWSNVELHRRYNRAKNLWLMLITYFICSGYSLQPDVLLVKNKPPRKKGEPFPNVLCIGLEEERYFVDLNGYLSEVLMANLKEVGSKPREVTDFDDRILCHYVYQTSITRNEYRGLFEKVRYRMGCQFMNQIVAVFARYNYEICSSTQGFFVVVGTDDGESYPTEVLSLFTHIAFKTRIEPYVVVSGNGLTPELREILETKIEGQATTDFEIYYEAERTEKPIKTCDKGLRIDFFGTDLSKSGKDREANFVLGILKVLNLAMNHGFEIHSSNIPGDFILVKKKESVQRIYANEYMASNSSTDGQLIVVEPIIKEVSNRVAIEITGNMSDFDFQMIKSSYEWKKVTCNTYPTGSRWRFYFTDFKPEPKRIVKAQNYLTATLNVLGMLGYRANTPFWEDMFCVNQSKQLWGQGTQTGTTAAILLQKVEVKPTPGIYVLINTLRDKHGFFLTTKGLDRKQPWMDDLRKRSGVQTIQHQRDVIIPTWFVSKKKKGENGLPV